MVYPLKGERGAGILAIRFSFAGYSGAPIYMYFDPISHVSHGVIFARETQSETLVHRSPARVRMGSYAWILVYGAVR